MIVGDVNAPWEQEETAGAIFKRLGHLKRAVLALLDRKPENRPTMAELAAACRRLLSSKTLDPSEAPAVSSSRQPGIPLLHKDDSAPSDHQSPATPPLPQEEAEVSHVAQ
jgi:hypothetical protein